MLDRLVDFWGSTGGVAGDQLLHTILAFNIDRLFQLELNFLLAIVDLRLGDILILQLLHSDGGLYLAVPTRGIGEHTEQVDDDEDCGNEAGNPQNFFFPCFLSEVLSNISPIPSG